MLRWIIARTKQALIFEEEIARIKTLSKQIKDNDIKELFDFVQKRYSETVFQCPEAIDILQWLYMRLSEGFYFNDCKILVKAEIIKDIHEKQILYARGGIK